MLLFAVAGILGLLATVLVWWGPRQQATSRRLLGGIALGLGIVVLALSIAGFGLGIWAHTATETSQLARAIAWGESSFEDSERFPYHAFGASADPHTFADVANSPVAGFTVGTSDESLEGFLKRTNTTAFIVLRGDDRLYEGYFNGSSREAIQTSFSVAKSFTATLVGTALHEGFISSLDDPLTEYLPELRERNPRFADITLRHLITMSSGLAFREGSSPWDDPANTYYGTDLRATALTTTEIEHQPGKTFDYNDWNVILMGLVLERATGMPLAEYMETRLWQPMGAEAEGSWSLDSEASGFEKVFVGVNGRAIDFAKLGWLYLMEGRRGNNQVVPAAFVEEATKVDTETNPAQFYQYWWWIDEPRGSYYAQGDHCQYVYVAPSADMVLVRHGLTCGDTSDVDIDWVAFLGDLIDWLKPQLMDG